LEHELDNKYIVLNPSIMNNKTYRSVML
jgi:hypothetical protein